MKALKLKLQSLGALRPEAWERICELMQFVELKTGQNFIRKEGSLAYVAEGLLKECVAQQRQTPAVISFIAGNLGLITRKHNEHHHLEACVESIIYYWDFEALESLYREFRELKVIYHGICAEYDALVLLRMRLLEMSVVERIEVFRYEFREVLPYLKKKDIANYLHLHYTHFLRNWNS